MTAAAILAVVLIAIVAVFQLALALGAPLGAAAWGGRNQGVLPTRLRIASGLVAIVVYPLIALYVLASAGLIDQDRLATGATGMWVLGGLRAGNGGQPRVPVQDRTCMGTGVTGHRGLLWDRGRRYLRRMQDDEDRR